MGLESAPRMAAEMGGAADPRDDPRARQVAAIGQRIVTESDAHRSPYFWNYRFFLLNDPDTVSAFALPGGQIFITRGLYDRLDDEAELAGVLAHEVAHVVNRHIPEQMAAGQLGEVLSPAVTLSASDYYPAHHAELIAALVGRMAQLRFSAADESEADRYGLRYMAQAGYERAAMLDVLTTLKQEGRSEHPPEFLSTHPLPDTRLQAIHNVLAQHPSNRIPRSVSRGRRLRPLNIP
jgi:predicted Zn-dependent protease